MNQALIAAYPQRNVNCFVALWFFADIFGKVKLGAVLTLALPDESNVLRLVHNAANYSSTMEDSKMKVMWRNDALCLKPETEVERQSLAAIALSKGEPPQRKPAFTGDESDLELGGIEH